MKKILIFGATGNVGYSTLKYIYAYKDTFKISVAVRDIESAKNKLKEFTDIKYKLFDFERPSDYPDIFENIDLIYLVRPPHISNVEKYFRLLLNMIKSKNIRKIVYLSVQGVETSELIPHHKIEKIIKQLGFDYIFLRPSYFMQNLLTEFSNELVKNGTIFLPSKRAKFNWVDVDNIGEVSSKVILDFDKYTNHAIDITGIENLDFHEVINLFNAITGKQTKYESLNPLCFYFHEMKKDTGKEKAFIKMLLHLLPRFQGSPEISDTYFKLTGKAPTSMREFIIREKHNFIAQ